MNRWSPLRASWSNGGSALRNGCQTTCATSGAPRKAFFKDAERAQLQEARKSCEGQLKEIEAVFTPVDIDPNRMLVTIEDDYAGKRALESLASIEEGHGRLPDYAREIFTRQWFAYLCGSFHYEIKHSPTGGQHSVDHLVGTGGG